MRITPDELVLWQWDGFVLNATIAYTWLVMALLAGGSWLVTRRLTDTERMSRWQNLLEVLVVGMRDQIRDVGQRDPGSYLPFVGTLFVFIAACNLLAVVPGFTPPTGSLSTTAALALCVLVAVPLYGIAGQGLRRYLGRYLQPSWLMLPFNVIGEASRTLALAIRLFGNVMSGTVVVGLLVSVAPFFFPVLLQLLGLLTGLVQAYIFAVLAMVYIASATRSAGGADEEEAAPAGEPPPQEQRRQGWTMSD